MSIEFTQKDGVTTLRGSAGVVQSSAEQASGQLGYMLLGIMQASFYAGIPEVLIDYTDDKVDQDALVEVTVTEDEKGNPVSVRFRNLSQEVSNE